MKQVSSVEDAIAMLESMMSREGLFLEELFPKISYSDAGAWALFYRGSDCKVQVCWSSREGSFDYFLAGLNVKNVYGLKDRPNGWILILELTDFDPSLGFPSATINSNQLWEWRKRLFEIHFQGARRTLLQSLHDD